jgi:uncharacterized BrkB/YihY/UPF0761 family membrane protein
VARETEELQEVVRLGGLTLTDPFLLFLTTLLDVYGSIGMFIVVMTWMSRMGVAMLTGGKINSEIEHAARLGKNPGEKELPAAEAAA